MELRRGEGGGGACCLPRGDSQRQWGEKGERGLRYEEECGCHYCGNTNEVDKDVAFCVVVGAVLFTVLG